MIELTASDLIGEAMSMETITRIAAQATGAQTSLMIASVRIDRETGHVSCIARVESFCCGHLGDDCAVGERRRQGAGGDRRLTRPARPRRRRQPAGRLDTPGAGHEPDHNG